MTLSQDTKPFCQMEKHTESLWIWASKDRRMELVLEENGKISVTLDGRIQPYAVPTNYKTIVSPNRAANAWNQAFNGLLHCATDYDEPEGKDEVLVASRSGMLQLFEWVSELCALFEVCSGQNRALMMEKLAKRINHFLGLTLNKKATDSSYFTHFFMGTVMLTGLPGRKLSDIVSCFTRLVGIFGPLIVLIPSTPKRSPGSFLPFGDLLEMQLPLDLPFGLRLCLHWPKVGPWEPVRQKALQATLGITISTCTPKTFHSKGTWKFEIDFGHHSG